MKSIVIENVYSSHVGAVIKRKKKVFESKKKALEYLDKLSKQKYPCYRPGKDWLIQELGKYTTNNVKIYDYKTWLKDQKYIHL